MKNIKISLFFSLSIILLSSAKILADDLEFRLFEIRNDATIAGEYHVELQARITTGTSPRTLNSLTADVYYDSRLTQYANPVGTSWGPQGEYARDVSRLSGYYRILITNSSVNFDGNPTPGTGNPPGWDVTTGYKTVVVLRWTIASLGSTSLSIADATDAAAYFNNYTNAPINGGAAPWVVTNNDLEAATPVELSAFNAKLNGNEVELSWETKTEVNNYGFEIERRIGSGELSTLNWDKLGFVTGNGNSNSPKEYTFIDKDPNNGNKFIYRLKQIDSDGKFEYSKEVEVELIPNEFSLFQNYPNPFNPVTNIKFALPKAAKVSLLVYNLLGENIATLLSEDKEAGFYDVQFDASNFSSGIYIFRLAAGDFVQTKKMTLLK